jgi:hypothetical protein
MTWEWVGPVATATVGAAGIFGTWLTGKQAGDRAADISRKTLTQQRLLSSEARKQQRLEDAYVELLDMAERAGQWAQMVLPMIDTNPPQPVPAELPSLEEQAHTVALVQAFGSHEVLEWMKTWRAVVKKIITTVELIKWEEADPATRQRAGEPIARVALDELRPQELGRREALAKQVAFELECRTDASLQPVSAVRQPARAGGRLWFASR